MPKALSGKNSVWKFSIFAFGWSRFGLLSGLLVSSPGSGAEDDWIVFSALRRRLLFLCDAAIVGRLCVYLNTLARSFFLSLVAAPLHIRSCWVICSVSLHLRISPELSWLTEEEENPAAAKMQRANSFQRVVKNITRRSPVCEKDLVPEQNRLVVMTSTCCQAGAAASQSPYKGWRSNTAAKNWKALHNLTWSQVNLSHTYGE